MKQKETLLTLTEQNTEYDALIEQFGKKIKTATTFYTEEEFIKSEIERIKTFIQPIEITIGGDFKAGASINYSEYTKHAYEWLGMGQNWEIEQIVQSAKQGYLSNSPKAAFNEKDFCAAIRSNLKRGVAFIKYEKFLKEELQKRTVLKIDKKSTTEGEKRKRKQIPRKFIALLQREVISRCPFCNSEDVDHFQIHHIDENRDNNQIGNLLMLCPTCHSKITKGDISRNEVETKKASLQLNTLPESKIGKIELSVGMITSPFEGTTDICLSVVITSLIKEKRFYKEPFFLLSIPNNGNNGFSIIMKEYLGVYPFQLEFGEQKSFNFIIDRNLDKMFNELSDDNKITAIIHTTVGDRISSNSITAKTVKDYFDFRR